VVRVLPERPGQGGGQPAGRLAGRIEHAEQGEGVGSHRLLHHGLLAQLRNPQHNHDGSRNGADTVLPAAPAERRLDPGSGYLQAFGRAGRDGQHEHLCWPAG
jgi:hypothetical protein